MSRTSRSDGGRVEHRPQRLEAERLDGRLVHERRVEGGDLAGVLGPSGRRRCSASVLDDLAHLLLGRVGQLHERPPARPVARDVLLVEPAAVDVAEQVVLRPDVEVHARAGVVQDAHDRRA